MITDFHFYFIIYSCRSLAIGLAVAAFRQMKATVDIDIINKMLNGARKISRSGEM